MLIGKSPTVAVPSAKLCKKRLNGIASRLPETVQRPGGERGRHIAFTVRGKTFAYFTNDHHGDGRLSLICRAPLDEQQALVGSYPVRFFIPPYLGHRGWVGLWLDTPTLDWLEAEELMIEAYRLAAPKRRAAMLD